MHGDLDQKASKVCRKMIMKKARFEGKIPN